MWEPLVGEMVLHLGGEAATANNGLLHFKISKVVESQLESMAKRRRTDDGTGSTGIQIQFDQPAGKAGSGRHNGNFTVDSAVYGISLDQLSSQKVEESKRGRGELTEVVLESSERNTLAGNGCIHGKVKISGLSASAEEKMGNTLKQMKREDMDAKQRARNYSGPRGKAVNKAGRSPARSRSPRPESRSMGGSRITPPKNGRPSSTLSAANSSSGGGGPATLRKTPSMQKATSQKQLNEQVKMYRDKSKEQAERKRKMDEITDPFADLGKELEAAANDEQKKAEIEKRILDMYAANGRAGEHQYKALQKEYTDAHKALINLKQNVDGYVKKHGGSA